MGLRVELVRIASVAGSVLGLCAPVAQAACPTGQELFTACRIEGRATEVSVCFDEDVAAYRYGPVDGPPELVLSDAIKTVAFHPWSGIGRDTAEGVTFRNGAFAYEVVGGFERLRPDEARRDETGAPDAETRPYGWVRVTRDGEELSRLACRPDSVTYGYGSGLHDRKVAAGLVWDGRSRSWRPGE